MKQHRIIVLLCISLGIKIPLEIPLDLAIEELIQREFIIKEGQGYNITRMGQMAISLICIL